MKIEFGNGEIGEGFMKLFNALRAIQDGNVGDDHRWMWPENGVDCSI